MGDNRNKNDGGMGYLEITVGKKTLRLSGWKGLLILAAGCFAVGAAVDVLSGSGEQPVTEPQTIHPAAPAP